MKHRRSNRIICCVKVLSVAVLLVSIFSIVWLRSNVVSLEYSLSSLEKKKTELLRDRKLLVADRANLLSVERFEKVASNGFSFPDRVRVVYVKRMKEDEPQRTALSKSSQNPSQLKLLGMVKN